MRSRAHQVETEILDLFNRLKDPEYRYEFAQHHTLTISIDYSPNIALLHAAAMHVCKDDWTYDIIETIGGDVSVMVMAKPRDFRGDSDGLL